MGAGIAEIDFFHAVVCLVTLMENDEGVKAGPPK
jgi:hypothetical protein